MSRRTLIIAAIATLVLAAFGATFAGAAKKLKNGGFESGSFARWSTEDRGAGEWTVYSRDHRATGSGRALPLPGAEAGQGP
jgi:hypothetical protein